MKPSIFLLVSLLWCFSLYAAELEESVLSQLSKQGGFLTFKNVKSGYCIGVKNASTNNGAYIQQFKCDLSGGTHPNNQHWIPAQGTCVKGAFCFLENQKRPSQNRRNCMGVDKGSSKPFANIRQFKCDKRANQKWKFVADSGGVFIQNFDGLCIGVDRAMVNIGAQLKQFRCDFGGGHRNNQHWRVCAGPQNSGDCVE
ncbi:MAG: ricin-type beta-trefoil lectin domain protein [Methylobacter sp.]|nr:ricin-type beta-trefoil lectin domain protein [Methylobacter sp.]